MFELPFPLYVCVRFRSSL